MFLAQMRTFKETAEAYISGSALPDPKSLADLTGSLDAAKRPTLELPIASSAERDLARGVYRDLQEIRVLLTDTPDDLAWAGRKLRRMAQFWGVDYEQAGVPRPGDLDKLVAHVEALAQRLMGRAGASSGEAAVEHAEREVRSFLEKLNVARTEAKGNLKRSRDGCALLEAQRQNTASELQHKTTQIEECERVLQLARKEKTELLKRKDQITEHLEFCDEVLTVLCNGIKHLDDKYSAAAALVDKAGQKGNTKNPPDVDIVLSYPIKDIRD
jgi:hypothetical protein